MDKATKVAVEKYPHGTFDGPLGDSLRAACAVGYMQAEKDLALSWEDIQTILNIENDIFHECCDSNILIINKYPKGEYYYGEILRRFQELKNK